MASSYSFRSALNGFNREDVVHYLEYINTKNANQVAALEQEIARLQSVDDYRNQVTALKQENTALRQELESLKAQGVPCGGEELEAYRRAERAERNAKQRADQVCQRVDSILADTGAKMDGSIQTVECLADQALRQIQQLQDAIVGGKAVLQESAVALRLLNREEE